MGAEHAGRDRARGDSATLEDERGPAYIALEKAYFKKDITAFYAAIEAYGRACFRFAETGGVWPNAVPAKEPPPPEEPMPEIAMAEAEKFKVHESDMTLNGKFHYITREGADPKDYNAILALCPRREDAERIRAALEVAQLRG